MFYNQQFVNKPDSPRKQSPIPWTFNKTLRTAHKHINTLKSRINIDHREIEEQIAQGFVYIQTLDNNKTIKFLYKIPAGTYTIHGFRRGSIDIPLPQLYVAGRLQIQNQSIIYNNIRLGSQYLPLLPLSNIHNEYDDESFEIETSNGKPIYYMKMCTGSALRDLIGEVNNPIEAINKLQSIIIPFFLRYGNEDLRLCPLEVSNLNSITARSISYYLEDQLTCQSNHYTRYWILLNYLHQKYDTHYIYQTLGSMRHRREIFNKFDITPADFQKYLKEYQTSANENRIIN